LKGKIPSEKKKGGKAIQPVVGVLVAKRRKGSGGVGRKRKAKRPGSLSEETIRSSPMLQGKKRRVKEKRSDQGLQWGGGGKKIGEGRGRKTVQSSRTVPAEGIRRGSNGESVLSE